MHRRAVQNALDATLTECDEGIAYIQSQLDEVKEDLSANKYAQDFVEQERRSVSSQLADAKCAVADAKRDGNEREAFSQQQSVDALSERLRQLNEEAHGLERDQADLEREREQVEAELDGAKRERDRLDREGHDLYNRLVEETESANSELQRQADLISSKR